MRPCRRTRLVIVGSLLLTVGAIGPVKVAGQRRQARIFASVVDREKAPILDLIPDDFELLVGGLKATLVRASLVREPMRIALLVDTSDEARDSLNHIRTGLQAFLDAIPVQNEVVIVSMGRQARVRVEPTADRAELKRAVDDLFVDGGAMVLLDALRESYDRFLRRLETRSPVFVIVATNGPDTSGTRDNQFEAFIRDIQTAAATAHAIMLGSSLTTFRNSKAWVASLNVTGYTGGHYESLAVSSALPGRLKALGDRIAAGQEGMRAVYEIDFITQSTDERAPIELHVNYAGASISLSATRPFR